MGNNPVKILFFFTVLVVLCSSCGQKGPLKIPGHTNSEQFQDGL